MLYAEVILPVPLCQTFTYKVPDNWQQKIEVGKRVIVSFGKRRLLTGIVFSISTNLSFETNEYKEIISVLDEIPLVNSQQLAFWQWISEYYMCTIGEVMQYALPSSLKLESKSLIILNPAFKNFDKLSSKEKQIVELLLSNEKMFIQQLIKYISFPNLFSVLRNLEKKGVIFFEEVVEEIFKPRQEKYIRLTQKAAEEGFLNEFYENIHKFPKQRELFEAFMQLSDAYGQSKEPKEVCQKILLEVAQATPSSLKALIRKGLFESYYKTFDQNFSVDNKVMDIPQLSSVQKLVINQIKQQFNNYNVVLLHGITGSGKTHIYYHLIKEQLEIGKQVLIMLPEIAITYQMIRRMKNFFGEKVAVYHSRMNDRHRHQIWNDLSSINKSRYQIILGVRSSIFLPFKNLGLIIIDEEHENTYKQFEPSPRYHARDAAIMLAKLLGAKILLGSATPSIESYYNAVTKKYGFVELTERHTGIKLPFVEIVNMRIAIKKGHTHMHYSDYVLRAIEQCIKEKKQIIIFQNRRGFAPYIQCQQCNYIFRCKYCDVSMTYHKATLTLVCHYCGFTINIPKNCEQCSSHHLKLRGLGTEKIEEELAIYFPDARIARMDLDTTRLKDSYDAIITAFENRQIDILIGTQMITKGLDFAYVGLVIILDADQLLNYPDFRAFERSFQLMVQVSGRAGRQNEQGRVIIQTFMPENKIIQLINKHDYKSMFNQQIAERKTFAYPPFVKLIQIYIKHAKENICIIAAQNLYKILNTQYGNQVLAPNKPLIARIQNMHIRTILIKLLSGQSLNENKVFIKAVIDQLNTTYQGLKIIVDVDPQ